VRERATVRAIEPRASGVRVLTDDGAINAGSVIVAAGPWLKSLLPDLPVRLRVTRQVMAWFAPAEPGSFAPGLFPVFLIESRHGMHYGFPPFGGRGVKVAKHHHRDEAVDPDRYDRATSTEDESLIRALLADHIPAANGPLLDAKTCLYTVTPDCHFVLDRLPDSPQVIVASPCSGHGFKFAPAIGEILADLATTGATNQDIARFCLTRFR
jgi:sarcosine oxidase